MFSGEQSNQKQDHANTEHYARSRCPQVAVTQARDQKKRGADKKEHPAHYLKTFPDSYTPFYYLDARTIAALTATMVRRPQRPVIKRLVPCGRLIVLFFSNGGQGRGVSK